MTIDVIHAETNALAALDSGSAALDRLAQWVEAASNANRLVAPLVDTAFVPDTYRPRIDRNATDKQKAEAHQIAVANATAAVLQGITLGLDPLTALQQIYIVHGRPGMYAKMMVALVQARGHEVWTEDLTDTRAVVAGRRRGSDQTERITVTMDQARRAGWTRNEAYGKTPQDMLWARAAARVCDRIASDAIKGLASVEAIQDELTPASAGTRTVAPPKRRARPAIQVTATVEPPLDDEPATDVAASAPAPLDSEPSITQAQQRKLHALLRERGLGDRDAGLARIGEILGRAVDSTKELTRATAAQVIDALEAPEPPLDTDEPELDDEPWPEVTRPGDAE